jgi:uncharacterized FlaG/YvyC family protein
MVDTNLSASSVLGNLKVSEPQDTSLSNTKSTSPDIAQDAPALKSTEVSKQELESFVGEVEAVVNAVALDTSLSFRVEEELSRMVVAVRAVGSNEIIRQFPPEEFITVAKHLAKLSPDLVDEDYLKGVLFDQRI